MVGIKEWETIKEDRDMQLEAYIEDEVLQFLDLSREIQDEEIYQQIDEVIQHISEKEYLSLSDKLRLRQSVFYSMRGLDVLTPLLQEDSVTEIMVNGYEHIFVERNGQLEEYPIHFRSAEKYHNIIQQVVADSNRAVNAASPIVDARLLDGSRVNVVLAPIALDGSTMTIRKFPKNTLTMEKLIHLESLSMETARFLELLVKSGYNIMISGGTGSGKTTFLNALSNYIPKSERIITIEDSAELRLEGVSNLVRLEVRNANVEGKNAITMKDLIKSSLRMRPDRIIVGEVRGEEALDMLQALNTGHDGSISTGHANSARDMLIRLETMVLMGIDMPMQALRGQISSALEIIIHLGRLRDHSRRVLEITEVLGMRDGEIECQTLFRFEEGERNRMNGEDFNGREKSKGEVSGRVSGYLVKNQKMKQLTKLKEAGYYKEYCNLMGSIKDAI